VERSRQGAAKEKKSMKLKFFSIPAYQSGDAGEELNSFCGNHKIASIEKQFVANGEQSYWAICITYIEGNQHTFKAGKNKIDYREVFAELEFAVFVKLRELRKVIADREGIPVYALFTNDQLAEMVSSRVTTLSGLSSVEGIGKGRIEKYGKEFLELLQKQFSEQPKTDKEPNSNETNKN